MKVTCPKCGADYDVHADRVPTEGIDMKCSKCLHTFKVYPHGSDAEGPAASGFPDSSNFGLKGVTFLGGQPAGAQPDDASERFFIQRRSGKVFGPFEKRLIVQMLKAHKLTGDESVSRDKAFWVPLTAIPDFARLLVGDDAPSDDVRGHTQFPGVGRPGPAFGESGDEMAGASFGGVPLPSPDQSNFDLSNLPGLGHEIQLADDVPELPAPAGFGGLDAELPAPAGFGGGLDAELPAPAGFGGGLEPELPAPAGFGGGLDAELPAPAGFGGGFDAELPAPAGFGGGLDAELPAPGGLGAAAQLPTSRQGGGFGAVGGFDAELPMSASGMGAEGVSHVRDKRDMRAGAELPTAMDYAEEEDLFDDESSDGFDGGMSSAFGAFGQNEDALKMAQAAPVPPSNFKVEVERPGSAGASMPPMGASAMPPSSPAAAATHVPDMPAAGQPAAGKGKKKAGKRRKVAAPLIIAIVLLALALVIVAGLIFTQTDLLGGGETASNGNKNAPTKVVKPEARGVNFGPIMADTHTAYQKYIGDLSSKASAKPNDMSTKSQLMVAHALYLSHYPEDEQMRKEAQKLAPTFKDTGEGPTALASGAAAVFEGDLGRATQSLAPLLKDKEHGYMANLLMGLTGLIDLKVEGSKEEGKDGGEKDKKDAAPAEEKEAKGAQDAPKEDGDKAAAEGEEKKDEPGAEGDKAKGDGDVEMDLVSEVIAEDDKNDAHRKAALDYLRKAAKLNPKAPAPRFFMARVERKRGRTAQARKHLGTLLKKHPEHVPGLLEMSMLSYLAGNLDAARDQAKPVTEALSAAASKRERSQSQLLLGLVYVARRQSEEAVTALVESLKTDPANAQALKALGEEFFRNRKFEEALNYFTTNQNLSQTDPEVMLGVVKSHIGLEQFDEAVKKLEAGVKTFPSDARFPFFLGLIHEKEGFWPEARRRYRAALQIDPSFSKSRVRLALLLLKDNKREESEKLLVEAEERGAAQDADVAVDIGHAYMLMGKRDKALKALQTALEINASNLDARIRLARYYLDQGNSEQAMSMLQPFLDTKVLDTELSLLLGDVYRAQKKFERSIEQYDRLVEDNPKEPTYLFKRGLAYFDWENFDTARDQFLKAYSLDPKYTEAYFYSGRVAFEQKDYGQAMKIFRAVLDEDQPNGLYRFYLAYALEKNDNPAQALEEYKNVERFAPKFGNSYPELFYRRGRLLASQGNYRAAKQDLASALTADPDHLGALLALADTLFDERDYERALKLYDQALEQNSELALANFQRGLALSLLGRQGDAVRAIERAVSLKLPNKRQAAAHEKLGFLYKASGNRGQAVRNFKKYLELLPDAPNRKDIKKEVRRLGGTL